MSDNKKVLLAYQHIVNCCREINLLIAELRFDLEALEEVETQPPPPTPPAKKPSLVLTMDDIKPPSAPQPPSAPKISTMSADPTLEKEYKFCVEDGKCRCGGKSRNKSLESKMTLDAFKIHRRRHRQHIRWFGEQSLEASD